MVIIFALGQMVLEEVIHEKNLREFFEIDANHIVYNALIAVVLKMRLKNLKINIIKTKENNPFKDERN